MPNDESIRIPLIIEGDQAFIFLHDFEKAAKKAASGIKSMADPLRSTANAGFAFNQILREAPAFAFNFQTGIMAISNNLPIFTDALKQASAAGASKGQILKDLAKNLVSLPSILSIATLALVSFGGELFGAGQKAAQSKQILDDLNNTLEAQEKFLKGVADQASFLNRIGKINLEISGGKQADLMDLQAQSVQLAMDLSATRDEIAKLTETEQNFFNQKLKGTVTEKDYVEGLKSIHDSRSKLWDDEKRLENEQRIAYRQIELQKKKDREQAIKDNEEALKKSEADIKKYIEEAKRLSKELQKAFFVVPEFNFYDTQKEQLEKATKLNTQYKGGTLKVSYPVEMTFSAPPAEELSKDAKTLSDKIREALFNQMTAGGAAASKEGMSLADQIFGTNAQLLEQFRAKFQAVGAEFKIDPNTFFQGNPSQNFSMLSQQLQKATNHFELMRKAAYGVADAFGEAFSSIAQGDDAFQAIGNSLKQLIVDLIRAAITSFILKNILGGLFPGAKGASVGVGMMSGMPRFAAGGLVSGATLAEVGEGRGTSAINPEVISPLDTLKSFFGSMLNEVTTGRSGGRSMQSINNGIAIPSEIPLRFNGSDLVGVMTLVQAKMQRGG